MSSVVPQIQQIHQILKMSPDPERFAWLEMPVRLRRQWLIDAGVSGSLWIARRTWHELTERTRALLIEHANSRDEY